MEIVRLARQDEAEARRKAPGRNLGIDEEKNAESVAEAADPPDLVLARTPLRQERGRNQREGGGEAGAPGRADGNGDLRD